MREPEVYKQDWNKFRVYCEDKAKIADCYINNKGWNKLREYHLEEYLKDMSNPFGFLFNIKIKHKNTYREIHCMGKYYCKYLRERQKLFDSPARSMVQFPTWRKK